MLTLDYASLAKYTGNIVDAFAHLVTQSGVVGEIMGELLNRFVAKGVSPSSFYLIGYSIGAHVVGHAARNVDGKIPRITGNHHLCLFILRRKMDPMNLFFSIRSSASRLVPFQSD